MRSITKFDLQYAHRFYGFKGEAQYLHGHTGVLTIEVEDSVNMGVNMVYPCNEIQKIAWDVLKNFDHALVLREDDPLLPAILDVYEKQGIRLQTHFMTNTLHTTLTVVKNSNNIGVIAATPHETLAEGLAKKPIKDSQLEFNKIFYWNKDRTMGLAAETFLAYFREEAKKDGAEV